MITKEDLSKFLKENKVPAYRLKQVLQAVYKEGKGDFNEISVLPKTVLDLLVANFSVFSFELEKEVISTNGETVKALFKLKDGKKVEGVLMHFKDGRNSVCVSSQVGCGLKCAFCATGALGFTRSLTAEEISDQVLYLDQYLKKKNGGRVTHVIFMGMGEPFLNYDDVMESIRTLNDPDCLGIAARHITVSTSGIIPGIKKFADEPLQLNLALSLHAPNQELREKLMPVAKAFQLPDLMAAIDDYIKKTGRRVSIEYVMLKAKNDSREDAQQLAKLLRGKMIHVNLIPYNETYMGFENSGRSRIDDFKKIIESHKIPVTVRVSLGQDISAACGQLATSRTPCNQR